MLSMSTSHPRDLDWPSCFRAIRASLLLLLAASNAHADGQTDHLSSPTKLNTTFRNTVEVALIKVFERDENLPGVGVIVSGQEQASRPISGNPSSWLMPIHVRYKSLTNSYCRLAIFDDKEETVRVVPLPLPALNDRCMKIDAQLIIDANGTGATDVVQSVRIRSNRGAYEILQAVVYLAHPQSESGYCFSTQASRELSPKDQLTASKANATLKSARSRLGVQEFSCD